MQTSCVSKFLSLWARHPDGLDNLEDRRADHDEDKEGLKINMLNRDFKFSGRFLKLTISSGLTGYLSSDLEDFVTLPLLVMFLAFFSLAFLICGVLGILMDLFELLL